MQKWTFLLLLFVVCNSGAQERELILWNKNIVSVSPWEEVSVVVAQKVHYTPKQNAVDLKYGEIFMEYEPKNWLEYGFGFRHSKLNIQNGNWLEENRPMFKLSLSKEIRKFELSFSNRLEYRTFKENQDYFRHRQSLKLNFPNITNWGMQFYVSEESYLKLDEGDTHLARFYTGLKAIDKTHLDIMLYYSLQKSKRLDYWLTSDVVGLNFSFTI
uniref:DUF2490 domain-containing protein n=1 Tax=uncultured Draconibacterium sp. TaxID=1573823 RepID=UPI0032162055